MKKLVKIIFLVIILFGHNLLRAQEDKIKEIIDKIINLQPISKINETNNIVHFISSLMDDKSEFIYLNEFKNGLFKVIPYQKGYKIIILNDCFKQNTSTKSNIKDIIYIKKEKNYLKNNDGISTDYILKIENVNKYFLTKHKYNDFTQSPASFSYVPMLIDMHILNGVVPNGQTDILNRERCETFLRYQSSPVRLFSGGPVDGTIFPDYYNGQIHPKVLTVDETWNRIVFCDYNFQPTNHDYFRTYGLKGQSMGYFNEPTGITYGHLDPANGYRLLFVSERANNRIQCLGYKINNCGVPDYSPNYFYISYVDRPQDVVHNNGISLNNLDDDVIWFSEHGNNSRDIICYKYSGNGNVECLFNKYTYGNIIRTVDATKLDTYVEYPNGLASRAMLAFVNQNSNSVALIHLKNGELPENSYLPNAFSEIQLPNEEYPTSVKFISDVPTSATNPVSVLISSNDQNGNGHIHKYKIIFSPYDNWQTPIYTEYLASSYAPYNSSSSNYGSSFSNLGNIEAQPGYSDIFIYEDWNYQYGMRKLKQGVCMTQNEWGNLFYKYSGTTWYTRLAGPVNANITGSYKSGQTWYPSSVKLNGVVVQNPVTLTAGTNYFRVLTGVPGGCYPYSQVKINITLYPIGEQSNSSSSQSFEKLYWVSPEPVGGCPYLYTFSDSNYNEENNILHKSEFEQNVNQDITDKYFLNYYPSIDPGDSSISLKLLEKNDDKSYFDQIKLIAIDHPIDTKIGITESNDIVLYSPKLVISPDDATQNGDDVTDELKYEEKDTTTIEGFSNDELNASFDLNSGYCALLKLFKTKIINCLKYFRQILFFKEINIKNSILVDSVAVILDAGSPYISNQNKNADAGVIIGISSEDSFTSVPVPFTRRQNSSNIIVPIAGSEIKIDSASISWNRDYTTSYIGVTPIFYGGFIETELPLIEAKNSNQESILAQVQTIEGDYAEMIKGLDLSFKFKNNLPEPQNGVVRDYCFVVVGHYNTNGDNKTFTNRTYINSDNYPKEFQLSQNYPNPFNPVTNIKYQLPKDGFVSLKVYDITGREIAKLVSEQKQAGYYTVSFNGSNFASGVYFYRIQAGDFVQVKKMVLVK